MYQRKPQSSETPILATSSDFSGTTVNDFFFAESKEEFGQTLGLTPSVMKSVKSVIDAGSTRGTGFIPGYTGYIPVDSENTLVKQYERQERERKARCDRIDTYTGHIPGYTGFRPHHVRYTLLKGNHTVSNGCTDCFTSQL